MEIENDRRGQGFNHVAFNSLQGEDLSLLNEELSIRGAQVLAHDYNHICFEAADGIVAEVFRQEPEAQS